MYENEIKTCRNKEKTFLQNQKNKTTLRGTNEPP